MYRTKRVVIWLVLVLLLAIGGAYLWYALQPKVEEIPEPALPEPTFDVPLPEEEGA